MNQKLLKNLIFTACVLMTGIFSSGCQSMWYMALDMIVDIVPQRFSFTQNNQELSIPIMTSHPLDHTDKKIQHLIVLIHGAGLNAAKSYKNGLQVAEKLGEPNNHIMVVVPQFLEGVDTDEKGMLFWDRTWRSGGLSLAERMNETLPRVSSYMVMDKIIEHIADINPDIKQVSILGHSAGGQFVNRYAAINNIHEKLKKRGISLLYVVANPSSYLYMDTKRYFMNSEGRIQTRPMEELTNCPTYNQYKYGLDALYGYAKSLSKQLIRKRFTSRPVLFVLGSEDHERSWTLDKSCEVELQGANRFERGLLYQHHVKSLIKHTDSPQSHWMIVPGVGHDANEIFNHETFIEKLKNLQL